MPTIFCDRRSERDHWGAALATWLVTFLPPAFADEAPPPSRSQRGLVTIVDEATVAAQRAGVVVSLGVKAGMHVRQAEELAKIDDEQAKLELNSAQAEVRAAKAKAATDVDVRYAEATHAVAVAEHRKGLEANEQLANAVSEIELERMRLSAAQAELKVESSKFERSVRGFDGEVVAARESLAALNLRQRRVLSPIEGEVVELMAHVGEWVEPGTPVLRIVGLKTLRVETFVRVADRMPSQLVGRKAEIRVRLAGGRQETFTGEVTFVSPIVQPGGDYQVWIEVANGKDGEQWLLRPGMEVDVVIGD